MAAAPDDGASTINAIVAERPAPRMPAARAALRAATAEAHERLHNLAAFHALAKGRLDRTAYAALLARLLGFHAPVEAALALVQWPPVLGLDPAMHRRAHALERDLRSLDGTDAPPALMPRPPIRDTGDALGWLYVVEGSALGGRLLARGLDGLLGGPAAIEGRRFLLSAEGERPGQRWQALCAALERAATADPESLPRMVAGASAAFAAFADWFAEAPAP